MRFTMLRRSARSAYLPIVLATLLSTTPGVTQAAVPVSDVGTHGAYKVTDSPARPGARCRYEGTAGTWYLQRIHCASHRRSMVRRHSSDRWATDSSCSEGQPTAGRPFSEGR